MLKTTRAATLFMWTAILLLPVASQAARPLGPPIEELVSGYNKVMAARAAERVDSGRVRFERVTPYYGDPADSIVLRTGEMEQPFIEMGQVYILGYTVVTNDTQFREVKFEDPDGPKIVNIRGVDVLAVFVDSKPLRYLFEQTQDRDKGSVRAALDAVMAQIQINDERARSLVTLELMLRPDLVEIISPADGRIVGNLITTDAVPMETRDILLQVSEQFPAAARAEWLVEAQRAIVKSAPDELPLASPLPSYVRDAVRGLKTTGDASDLPELRRLLGSNAPGGAKAALDTMDGLDPEATLQLAREAFSDQSLLAETRRVLELYLRQNDTEDLFLGS